MRSMMLCLVLPLLALVSTPVQGKDCISDCGCPAGQICRAHEDGNRCEVGTCTTVYEPVCGLDGETYSNACRASLARVGVAHEGRCEKKGVQCDGLAGTPCPGDQFCDHGPGQCRVADAAGICTDVPPGCPEVIEPVCGCDGRTYDNDCLRIRARAQLDHRGACEDDKDPITETHDGCGCCLPTVVSAEGDLVWSADPALDAVSRADKGRYRVTWKIPVEDDAFFVQPFAPTDDFPRSLLGWPARISDEEIEVTTDAHYVGRNDGHDHRENLDVRFSLLRCPEPEAL